MKKLVLGSLLALATIQVSPASAQFFGPVGSPLGPNIFNPYTPFTPFGFSSPFGGGFPGFGFPGMGFPGGGFPGGGFGYPGFGYPGFGGGNVGYGPTGFVPPGGSNLAGASGYAPPSPVNLGTPAITGHPTRFFNYAQYFFNQGGMTAGTGVPQILGVNPGQAPQSVIGMEGLPGPKAGGPPGGAGGGAGPGPGGPGPGK